jgi:hypothetical protein
MVTSPVFASAWKSDPVPVIVKAARFLGIAHKARAPAAEEGLSTQISGM